MPLYEYRCRDCDRRFEEIVRGGAKPRCPSCGSARLAKLLSAFAVGGGRGPAPSEAPAGCGSCGDPRGPGSCASD